MKDKDKKGLGILVAIGAGIAGIALAARAKAKPPEPGLATLYGIVSDAATGQPIEGVSVSLWSPDGTELLQQTFTNGTGSYALKNILPGAYAIMFEKEGYESEVR